MNPRLISCFAAKGSEVTALPDFVFTTSTLITTLGCSSINLSSSCCVTLVGCSSDQPTLTWKHEDLSSQAVEREIPASTSGNASSCTIPFLLFRERPATELSRGFAYSGGCPNPSATAFDIWRSLFSPSLPGFSTWSTRNHLFPS